MAGSIVCQCVSVVVMSVALVVCCLAASDLLSGGQQAYTVTIATLRDFATMTDVATSHESDEVHGIVEGTGAVGPGWSVVCVCVCFKGRFFTLR